jgi:hypothetical protein
MPQCPEWWMRYAYRAPIVRHCAPGGGAADQDRPDAPLEQGSGEDNGNEWVIELPHAGSPS